MVNKCGDSYGFSEVYDLAISSIAKSVLLAFGVGSIIFLFSGLEKIVHDKADVDKFFVSPDGSVANSGSISHDLRRVSELYKSDLKNMGYRYDSSKSE
ncbi:MAG: hypothetical protein AABW73_01660 [Nanoarchaeota archaeon]